MVKKEEEVPKYILEKNGGVSVTLFKVEDCVVTGCVTAKTVSEDIGTTPRTIENHLSRFRNNDIIERKGSDKAGQSEICKQI